MKKPWVLMVLLTSGCSLIDAAKGPDAPIIVNDEPIVINTTNNTVDSVFEPRVCAWWDCECVTFECDPKVACAPTECRTCRSDEHCASGDSCLPDGYCGACYHELPFPDSYGVYECGYDVFDNFLCFDSTCFPDDA